MRRFSFVFAYIILLAVPASITTYFVADAINFKLITVVIMLSMIVGGMLEIWAVKQGKRDKFYVWEYNNKTTLGNKILGIAVEDLILFLILTPIFCISMWEFVKRYIVPEKVSLSLLLPASLILIIVIYSLVFKITDFSNHKKNKKRK